MSMRRPEVVIENDRIVWVRGANGVQVPKWLSKIQHRVDVQILGDYEEGQTEYVAPAPAPKKTRTPKKTKEVEEAVVQEKE